MGLAKSQIEAAYAAGVNGANLGNFLTNKYSFLERTSGRFDYGNALEIERRFAGDIEHVHHKLEADIRHNQVDEPTDAETFNDVVVWPQVRERLEQIVPPQVEIALQ